MHNIERMLEESLRLNQLVVDRINHNINLNETLVRLTAMPMFQDMHETLDSRQLGLLETIELIRDEKLSFSRFGDGEFMLMQKIEYDLKFQRNSPQLQTAMRDAIHFASENEDKILVGYPHLFHNQHWTSIYSDVWPMMKSQALLFRRLGNSHVSRPLAFKAVGASACDAWRGLWEGSRATIVTGKGSRFDLEPALFSNLKSVEFVHSSPTNAFMDVDRLVKELADLNSELVLISLGPAGSILAVELAKLGIQALDIGHLSSSYRNVMEGGLFPEDTSHIRR